MNKEGIAIDLSHVGEKTSEQVIQHSQKPVAYTHCCPRTMLNHPRNKTDDQLKEIEDNNQVAVYYCNENGETDKNFNPNGSTKNIAGIFNKEKNVLGMMPHPERMIDQSLSGEDGSLFFKNLINNMR